MRIVNASTDLLIKQTHNEGLERRLIRVELHESILADLIFAGQVNHALSRVIPILPKLIDDSSTG